MIVVNLENLEGLPEQFLKQLSNYDHLFKKCDHLENLEKVIGIQNIISEINNYAENNAIIAFHYTRAIPKEISETGLICRSGSEIRESFLEKFSTIFTAQEIEKI